MAARWAAWSLAVGGLLATVLTAASRAGARPQLDRAAREIEAREALPHNALIVAWQLAQRGDAGAHPLHALAVQRGNDTAGRLRPARHRYPGVASGVRRLIALLLATVVACGAALWWQGERSLPRGFVALGERVLTPWRDAPPYAATRVTVDVSALSPVAGEAVTITATFEAPTPPWTEPPALPTEAWLELEPTDTQPARRVAMRPQPVQGLATPDARRAVFTTELTHAPSAGQLRVRAGRVASRALPLPGGAEPSQTRPRSAAASSPPQPARSGQSASVSSSGRLSAPRDAGVAPPAEPLPPVEPGTTRRLESVPVSPLPPGFDPARELERAPAGYRELTRAYFERLAESDQR